MYNYMRGKAGVKLLVSFVLVLTLMSFASAGIFDFLTGSVVDGGECYDTDGGVNYYEKGTLNSSNPIFEISEDVCAIYPEGAYEASPADFCNGDECIVIELSCNNNLEDFEYYNCPNGCNDGACISDTSTIKSSCQLDSSGLRVNCEIFDGETISTIIAGKSYDFSIYDFYSYTLNDIIYDSAKLDVDGIFVQSIHEGSTDRREDGTFSIRGNGFTESGESFLVTFFKSHCIQNGKKCISAGGYPGFKVDINDQSYSIQTVIDVYNNEVEFKIDNSVTNIREGESSESLGGLNVYVEFITYAKSPFGDLHEVYFSLKEAKGYTNDSDNYEEVKEDVKCVFFKSIKTEKCYTDDEQFECFGIESCVANVFGENGSKLGWKSSCGGYDYTIIDGNSDYAEFYCLNDSTDEDGIINNECFSSGDFYSCFEGESYGEFIFAKEVTSKYVIFETKNDLMESISPKLSAGDLWHVINVDGEKIGIDIKEIDLDGERYRVLFVVDDTRFIEEDSNQITCDNGCLVDDKCLPYGHRKSGDFCSTNNEMIEQQDAETSCDNNFECSSNLCIDSACVDGSTWQKIMAWFSRLF